ncbi:mechanosensitive ion channel protein MscS [Nitratireductor aestuarii]|uniref:Mechanosensitive ion channel protein MscS n=1 Tax=Nitratireductor aestuarii TaxID=1735103 RepID=A0A916RZN2_9HYPH|nr:mechanosensitive ion channel protein MscS [Nitratireductor aestuarii]
MTDIQDLVEQYPAVQTGLALIALALTALIANFIVKALLLRGLNRLLSLTSFGRDPEVSRHRVIERLANATPAIVISAGILLVPGLPAAAVIVIRNVANAFTIITVALAMGGALNVLDALYRRRPEARLKPIKGYLQVAKIVIYTIAAILVIATLIDRSPIILLSGLGAITAVLILVFQDTLLSLVAGIQISSTDMVRVGDWITVPGQDADGDVIEIALHTVKVQNFDKTVTTVPIRKLVTDPFRNWRAMQESGGRRIKRSLLIDQSSIRFLTPDELTRLSSFVLLKDYLGRKAQEIAEWNAALGEAASVPANTRRATNIGTFRMYVQSYLRAHPNVHQGMTVMVRQLEPEPQGLPLEIYCFANTVVWVEFEAIQADIFDHLLAILPEFGLRVFQEPSGADMRDFARLIPFAG